MPCTEYHHNGATYRSYRHGWGAVHKAVEMKRALAPEAEIADATGIPRTTLHRLFRALHLTRGRAAAGQVARARDAGRDYPAMDAEAARLYVHGRCSKREVAEILGVSQQYVRAALRRQNVRERDLSTSLRLAWQTRRAA